MVRSPRFLNETAEWPRGLNAIGRAHLPVPLVRKSGEEAKTQPSLWEEFAPGRSVPSLYTSAMHPCAEQRRELVRTDPSTRFQAHARNVTLPRQPSPDFAHTEKRRREWWDGFRIVESETERCARGSWKVMTCLVCP